MALCEENYQQLLTLAPLLATMKGQHCSSRPDAQDLFLEILQQSPYTTLVHVTYRFPGAPPAFAEPDAVLRVYHDANQVEIIDLRQNSLPVRPLYQSPGLANKWRASQFLSRWLSFCRQQGHTFIGAHAEIPLQIVT